MIGLSWAQVGVPGDPAGPCTTCRRLTGARLTLILDGREEWTRPMCHACAAGLASDLTIDTAAALARARAREDYPCR